MNDIAEIIKSWEDLGVLLDGVTETVKHEIKRRRICWSIFGFLLGFFGFLDLNFVEFLEVLLAVSLAQQVIFSEVKAISGTGVRRAGRRYIDKHFSFRCII